MKTKALLAAGAASLAMSGMASAVTLGASDSYIEDGFGGVAIVTEEPRHVELTFSGIFGTSPFFAYQIFTTTNETTVTLEDYQPTSSGDARSFFTLVNLDTDEVFTTQTSCTEFGELSTLGDRSCNEVAGEDGTGGFDIPPLTFSELDGGTYLLGVYESGDPAQVQFDFKISEVPLPAAGWMLLAGIGGMAALRRRQKS